MSILNVLPKIELPKPGSIQIQRSGNSSFETIKDYKFDHENFDADYKLDATLHNNPLGIINDYEADMRLNFEAPNWGIKNYIAERTSWQKQLDSLTGEPGWFYFKIFFKFNTNYGLLGGIMTDANQPSRITYTSVNTALQYLLNNRNRLKALDIDDRILALGKFACMLSFINGRAPWFFKGINNLDKAFSPSITELNKNKEIELEFMEDAVDMRVTTLFDLYKYACFDYVGMREIIPENLRKFDMTIVLYHTPLKYYQTGTMFENGTVEYKHINDGENPSNRMSFKMFTLHNCEFDAESLQAVIPNEMRNDKPFNLANSRIKIKYDRVYQHNMNEWNETLFGDNGFLWNSSAQSMAIDGTRFNNMTNVQQKRMEGMANAVDIKYYYNRSAAFYKSMVDASEAMICDTMRTVNAEDAFGNMYGDYDVGSKYFKNKLRNLKNGTLPSLGGSSGGSGGKRR